MAIDIELAGLKAAGTYRFERDLSARPSSFAAESYSNLRLIVGFSKKGPFNSVQLITSSSEFIKMYGNIDRSLEKRGSYFHRSALVALSAGPILCLNLLKLDPENDQIMHRSFSTNVKDTNKLKCTIPYQNVYNTDKFWQLSSESYLDSVKIAEINENNVLNFTNVGNKPISVLVKKATGKNIKGYEISINEWFGEENVPEYLNGTSFVSDYMVEVYVVSGDFGPELTKSEKPDISKDEQTVTVTYEYQNIDSDSDVEDFTSYKRFASDITYQEYFDNDGFKSNKLNKFLSLPSVNVVGTYVGSLLPNFTNKLNQNIWIEDMINKDTMSTGLLCSIDIDMIESATLNEDAGFVDEIIDIIGHNFYAVNDNTDLVDFLSYGFSNDRKDELLEDGNSTLTYKGEISICEKLESIGDLFYINANGVALNVNADNEVIIYASDFTEGYLKVGDMLLSCDYKGISEDGTVKKFSRLTRVVEIKPLYNDKGEKDENHFRVICSDVVYKKNGKIIKYATFDDICDRYHWTCLKGFKVNEKSMPDGTNERQNEILDMISENNANSNLYKSLIDRDYVQCRYLVDTFCCCI